MNEAVMLVVLLLGASLSAVTCLWIFKWLIVLFACPRDVWEAITSASDRELDRLLHPDFAGFQSFYGAPPPNELKSLYANPGVLVLRARLLAFQRPVDGSPDCLQYFLPMNAHTFRFSQDCVGSMRFAFALDDSGGCFYIDVVRDSQAMCPVYVFDEELGEGTLLTRSIADFCAALRREHEG